MNVRRWVSLSLTASAVALAAACSSSSSSDDSATGGGNDAGSGSDSTTGGGDSGGGGTDSGGGGAKCGLNDGTYLMHYTAKAGNSDNCTTPPDHTVTYPLPVSDAGAVDAGSSCTNTQSQTSTDCTNTITCTSDVGSFTNTLTVSVTVTGGGTAATGEEDDTLTYPDGGSKVCNFTVSFTKQ